MICWDLLDSSKAVPCHAAEYLDVIPVGPVVGIGAVVLRIEVRVSPWRGSPVV